MLSHVWTSHSISFVWELSNLFIYLVFLCIRCECCDILRIVAFRTTKVVSLLCYWFPLLPGHSEMPQVMSTMSLLVLKIKRLINCRRHGWMLMNKLDTCSQTVPPAQVTIIFNAESASYYFMRWSATGVAGKAVINYSLPKINEFQLTSCVSHK